MMPSERSSAPARLCYPPILGVPRILSSQAAAPAQTVPLSASSERIGSIDLLRILAALGIIWFHIEEAPARHIGYAGLPVFLLIFFSLVSRQASAHTTACFLQRRWSRLLRPWLFWSVVYGLCRLGKAVSAADWSALSQMASWETFLAGTCIHLWYLPYAFLAGVAVHVCNRRLLAGGGPAVVAGATLLGVLVLVGSAVDMSHHAWIRPLPQWEFGLATIPLGVAIGKCLMSPSRQIRNLLLSMVCGATLAGCAVLVLLGLAESAIPYALAVALVCLACGWQMKNHAFIAALAPLTFGIYLIHPMVIHGFRPFFAPAQNYPVFILLTAGISGLITLALLRTPLRRFV